MRSEILSVKGWPRGMARPGGFGRIWVRLIGMGPRQVDRVTSSNRPTKRTKEEGPEDGVHAQYLGDPRGDEDDDEGQRHEDRLEGARLALLRVADEPAPGGAHEEEHPRGKSHDGEEDVGGHGHVAPVPRVDEGDGERCVLL